MRPETEVDPGAERDVLVGIRGRYIGDEFDVSQIGYVLLGLAPLTATAAQGLYDLGGNVWEWVNDWISDTYYQQAPAHNPPGPDSGVYHGLRGGSWSNDVWDVRSASRSWSPTDDWGVNFGFRCAASL